MAMPAWCGFRPRFIFWSYSASTLKGSEDPVRLYEVRWRGEQSLA